MSQDCRVDIYCDGDEKIGLGHIRRSCALAAQLEKDGMDVHVYGLSDQARKILPLVNSNTKPASIVIYDSPREIDDLIKSALQKRQTTITLDWFGETAPDINIAIYPHEEVRASRLAYTGFEFIIVREEIRALHWSPPEEEVRRVLVVLGGGDLMRQGHQSAAILCNHGLDVTLVQGPLAIDDAKNEKYRVMVNPLDYPQLLASTDWAVTNGGSCLFEALYCGKAAVVLPQTDKEFTIANIAKEKGAVLGIGINDLRAYERETILNTAERGKELIDGRGVERISSIVRAQL